MKLRSGRVIGTTSRVRTRTRRRTAVRGTAARTARAVVRREIRRQHEIKRHFRSSAGSATPAALVFQHALGGNMAQGDAIGEREGSKIDVKSMHMRLNIRHVNTTLAGGQGWFRLLVVQRLHPQGGVLQLFKSNMQNVEGYDYITTGDVNQITAPINEKRYKVMLDKRIRLLPYDLNSAGRNMVLKRYKLRINRKLNFSTTTATDADVTPNIFYLGFVQWDDGGTTSALAYNLKVWTYFTDN